MDETTVGAAAEPARPHSAPGTVVLDVGAAVGALVLIAPPELEGREIEISSRGDAPGPRTHSEVRPRTARDRGRFAAVYPQLPAGTYTVWGADGAEAMTVTIRGGEVETAWWPGTGPR